MDMPSTVSQYLVLGKNRLTIADFDAFVDMPSTVSQYLVLGKNRLTIADFFL